MKISDIDTFVLGLDPKPQPVEEDTYQEPEEEEAPADETPKTFGVVPSGGTIAVTLSDAEVLAVIGPLHSLQRNAALSAQTATQGNRKLAHLIKANAFAKLLAAIADLGFDID